MSPACPVIDVLRRHRAEMAGVVQFDLRAGGVAVFDFTAANDELAHLDINDAAGFTDYLFERVVEAEVPVGIGRYDEDRVLYRHSPLFDGDSGRRSVHIGIDLFVAEETPISAPLAGVVHSFADNAGVGNYGPTVVLAHRLDGVRFFTLYGHLSRTSLATLGVGMTINRGDQVGLVGDLNENGGWPPHLHFQLVTDIGTWRGDFPGVAAPSQRERWLARCPDPNLILGVPGL